MFKLTLIRVQIVSLQLVVETAAPRVSRILKRHETESSDTGKSESVILQGFGDAPHIESAVQHRRQMLILHPHAVGADVVQTDRAVPRRHQQELSRGRAELHGRDAVLRTLGQLELVGSGHLNTHTDKHTHLSVTDVYGSRLTDHWSSCTECVFVLQL